MCLCVYVHTDGLVPATLKYFVIAVIQQHYPDIDIFQSMFMLLALRL